jgi:MSHA biogenesis protein MshN
MGGGVNRRGAGGVVGNRTGGMAMSVINQMLNQLEQRGAHTAAEQTMVRAVPSAVRNFTVPLLAIGLTLLAGIAAWQWLPTHKLNEAAVSITPPALLPLNVAGNPPGFDEPAKLISQQLPVEIITPSANPAPDMPASRLSFELSSVRMPSAKVGLKSIAAENPSVTEQPTEARAEPPQTKSPASNTQTVVQLSTGTLPMKQVSAAQRADAEFRKAAALMQQGRIDDAVAGYEAALRLDAGHDAARQALVALLLESKRGPDAERVLQERLNSKPDHIGFTMMLARLQVERGAVDEAIATMGKALPYANSHADYQAFMAALLQRQDRNNEAIAHYQIALKLAPNNGIWLMGYGISLQAMQRNTDAKVAFQHALDTNTLSQDLQAFVQQKIKGL